MHSPSQSVVFEALTLDGATGNCGCGLIKAGLLDKEVQPAEFLTVKV
jgi:hypothetical protein